MPDTYFEKAIINAIVETPKDSHYKYNYDPKLKAFVIKKSLPQGMHFPFSFGFIPGTLGQDGDPLDILILAEYPLAVGTLARVKLIGALEAEQVEHDASSNERNDRLIGYLVNEEDDPDAMYDSASSLPEMLQEHIAAFFVQLASLSRKTFKPLGWCGPNHARTLLEKGIEAAKET